MQLWAKLRNVLQVIRHFKIVSIPEFFDKVHDSMSDIRSFKEINAFFSFHDAESVDTLTQLMLNRAARCTERIRTLRQLHKPSTEFSSSSIREIAMLRKAGAVSAGRDCTHYAQLVRGGVFTPLKTLRDGLVGALRHAAATLGNKSLTYTERIAAGSLFLLPMLGELSDLQRISETDVCSVLEKVLIDHSRWKCLLASEEPTHTLANMRSSRLHTFAWWLLKHLTAQITEKAASGSMKVCNVCV